MFHLPRKFDSVIIIDSTNMIIAQYCRDKPETSVTLTAAGHKLDNTKENKIPIQSS